MNTSKASRDHRLDVGGNLDDEIFDDNTRNDSYNENDDKNGRDLHELPNDGINGEDDDADEDDDDGSYHDGSDRDNVCDYDDDDDDSFESDDDDDDGHYDVNDDSHSFIEYDDDDASFDNHEQLTHEVDMMRHQMRHIHDRQEKQQKVIIVILALLLGVLVVNLAVQLRLLAGYHLDTGGLNDVVAGVANNVDSMGDLKGGGNKNDNFSDATSSKNATVPTKTNTITRINTNPATRIYTHSTLSSKNYRAGGILSEEMLETYERDGVLVIRNLISPKLLDRLDLASKALIDTEDDIVGDFGGIDDRDQSGDEDVGKDVTDGAVKEKMKKTKRKKKKKGKQFHMVKNGAIFLGVPPPRPSDSPVSSCSSTDNEETEEGTCISDSKTPTSTTTPDSATTTMAETRSHISNNTIMSSFRDLAMYSKLPRVAASLLRLDEARVGGKENLMAGRRRGLSHKMTQGGESDGEGDNMDRNVEFEVDESVNLRICRDIFLTKDDDPYACGWHVDDTGFWPSIASDPGVNAWVALDDMPWPWSRLTIPKSFSNATRDNSAENAADKPLAPVATFALSIGSHRAPWRHDAYRVTGSAHTNPPEGFQSAADLIRRRSGSGTCNIQPGDPELYEKLEENKVVYDLKRGDVIFHDRWVFHRTVTVDEYLRSMNENIPGEEYSKDDDESDASCVGKIFRRYSIRYSPGTARVPPGYGVELSVLHNPDNANRTLNEVSETDGPWYPKVWPHVLKQKPNREENCVDFSDDDFDEEIRGLGDLVHVKIPSAERKQAERKKEIHRLLTLHGGR